jgi:hypothetical protein
MRVVVLLLLTLLALPAQARKIPAKAFARDGQPIEIHSINCFTTRDDTYVTCLAPLESLSPIGISAFGYRVEGLRAEGDHETIFTNYNVTEDFAVRAKETNPSRKPRGPIKHGGQHLIREEDDGELKEASQIHIHILFVELADGTLPGGIQPEFAWVYELLKREREGEPLP